MDAVVRPDMLKAALSAKLAAASSQLLELREAEQPRVTPHLNPREIIAAFLLHIRGVYPIADHFGKAQAGDLVFNSWYETWRTGLAKPDLALWDQLLHPDRVQREHGHGAELIEDEISVAADPSITAQQTVPSTRPEVRKRRVRFAAHANRPASDVCGDYVRLARRFIDDFVRDHERFLP